MNYYRKCFVPTCENDSENCPNKMFVRIREDLREKWCREVNTEYFNIYTMYCCEDHFDPEDDLKNYYKYSLMKSEPVFKPTAKLRYIDSPEIKAKECPELYSLLTDKSLLGKERNFEDESSVEPQPGTSSEVLQLKEDLLNYKNWTTGVRGRLKERVPDLKNIDVAELQESVSELTEETRNENKEVEEDIENYVQWKFGKYNPRLRNSVPKRLLSMKFYESAITPIMVAEHDVPGCSRQTFSEEIAVQCDVCLKDSSTQVQIVMLDQTSPPPAPEPGDQEYTEPEIKIEPEETDFTIVIQDPLTQTKVEGSYSELFPDPGAGPVADFGLDPIDDPIEEPSDDHDDNRLVIDEPPAKKQCQPPKPKPVLDINYYKAELARYKQEVMEQMTEIQKQHKQIKVMDDEIQRLKSSARTLREKNTKLHKENLKLSEELRTAHADLEIASKEIIELKRKEFAAKTSLAGKKVPKKTKQKKEKSTEDNELTELATQIEERELATQIEERELATQIINSINDNLVELATQINEATEISSNSLANRLIHSMNMQLTTLETQIRKQEVALATQRERQEVMMATQSILIDDENEEASVREHSDMETEGLTDTND